MNPFWLVGLSLYECLGLFDTRSAFLLVFELGRYAQSLTEVFLMEFANGPVRPGGAGRSAR